MRRQCILFCVITNILMAVAPSEVYVKEIQYDPETSNDPLTVIFGTLSLDACCAPQQQRITAANVVAPYSEDLAYNSSHFWITLTRETMMNGSCDKYEFAYNYTCKTRTLPDPCSHCHCCLQGINLQVRDSSAVNDTRESLRPQIELGAIMGGVSVFTALILLLMVVPVVVQQMRVWNRLKNRRIDAEEGVEENHVPPPSRSHSPSESGSSAAPLVEPDESSSANSEPAVPNDVPNEAAPLALEASLSTSSVCEDSDTASCTTGTTAVRVFSPRNLHYTGDEGSTVTPYYTTGDETSRPSSLRSLESLREEEEGEEEPREGEGAEASSAMPHRPDVQCHGTIDRNRSFLSSQPVLGRILKKEPIPADDGDSNESERMEDASCTIASVEDMENTLSPTSVTVLEETLTNREMDSGQFEEGPHNVHPKSEECSVKGPSENRTYLSPPVIPGFEVIVNTEDTGYQPSLMTYPTVGVDDKNRDDSDSPVSSEHSSKSDKSGSSEPSARATGASESSSDPESGHATGKETTSPSPTNSNGQVSYATGMSGSQLSLDTGKGTPSRSISYDSDRSRHDNSSPENCYGESDAGKLTAIKVPSDQESTASSYATGKRRSPLTISDPETNGKESFSSENSCGGSDAGKLKVPSDQESTASSYATGKRRSPLTIIDPEANGKESISPVSSEHNNMETSEDENEEQKRAVK